MKADPNFVPEPHKEKITDDEHMADLVRPPVLPAPPYGPAPAATRVATPAPSVCQAAPMKVGDRCEINPGGKRGTVQFVGKIPAIAAGYWARPHF